MLVANIVIVTVNHTRPALMYQTSVVDKLLSMLLISVLLLALTTSVHSQGMTTPCFKDDIVLKNAAFILCKFKINIFGSLLLSVVYCCCRLCVCFAMLDSSKFLLRAH